MDCRERDAKPTDNLHPALAFMHHMDIVTLCHGTGVYYAPVPGLSEPFVGRLDEGHAGRTGRLVTE